MADDEVRLSEDEIFAPLNEMVEELHRVVKEATQFDLRSIAPAGLERVVDNEIMIKAISLAATHAFAALATVIHLQYAGMLGKGYDLEQVIRGIQDTFKEVTDMASQLRDEVGPINRKDWSL